MILNVPGGLRVCNYCYKIVQSYTQELDMARNLEHIQADLRAVSMDSGDLTAMGANASTKPKSSGFPFEFDDDESFFHHTRRPSTGSTHSAYYERMEKEMQTPMQTVRSPFDAFGVCAAEADLLKQVGPFKTDIRYLKLVILTLAAPNTSYRYIWHVAKFSF